MSAMKQPFWFPVEARGSVPRDGKISANDSSPPFDEAAVRAYDIFMAQHAAGEHESQPWLQTEFEILFR
jgi:hypothetical protein